jgi:hypothetical protein
VLNVACIETPKKRKHFLILWVISSYAQNREASDRQCFLIRSNCQHLILTMLNFRINARELIINFTAIGYFPAVLNDWKP